MGANIWVAIARQCIGTGLALVDAIQRTNDDFFGGSSGYQTSHRRPVIGMNPHGREQGGKGTATLGKERVVDIGGTQPPLRPADTRKDEQHKANGGDYLTHPQDEDLESLPSLQANTAPVGQSIGW